MEQTMVLKNVEGDTIKQLQLIDGKTRTVCFYFLFISFSSLILM
jgi:hypothetical protein